LVAPNAAFIPEGARAGTIYANVTADDKTLFVSNEFSNTIAVIDLESLRAHGLTPAVQLGRIPVGASPIALTFSADER
jgi:DNA-binding beta-propeller fold protein YncE